MIPRHEQSVTYRGHTIRPRGAGVQVYLGRGPSGRRIIRQFTGEAAARQAIDEHLRQRKLTGRAARSLSPDELIDAYRALESLQGRATLQAAAQCWLAANTVRVHDVTVGELVAEYLQDMGQRQCREASIRNVRVRTRAFAERFGALPVRSLVREDVEPWIQSQGWQGRNLHHYLAVLTSLFRWAVKRNLADHSPLDGISRPKLQGSMPAIMRPGEVSALLNEIARTAPQHRTAAALCWFAGIRPDGEMRGLKWEHIRLDCFPPVIVIPPEIAKRRHVRAIEIQPNLYAWMRLDAMTGEGAIMPDYAAFRRAVQRAAQAVGVQVPDRAGRHAFATYGMATFGMEKTAQMLGHTDTKLLHDNYKGVPPVNGDAAAYWEILPE